MMAPVVGRHHAVSIAGLSSLSMNYLTCKE
jgi:hypothetical protein